MSDEAIYARWQEAAAAGSSLSPMAFIASVVRSEVERVRPPKLTDEQMMALYWKAWGEARDRYTHGDDDGAQRLHVARRLRGEP